MFLTRKEATLLEIQPVSIHGSLYCDILYAYNEETNPQPQAARIGGEVIFPGARPGDHVLIERVAGVVTRVEKMSEQGLIH